jgi:hypothetical protein
MKSSKQLPFAFGTGVCTTPFPEFAVVEPVDRRQEAVRLHLARCARVLACQPPALPSAVYEDDPDDPVLQVRLIGRLDVEYPRMNGRRWVF